MFCSKLFKHEFSAICYSVFKPDPTPPPETRWSILSFLRLRGRGWGRCRIRGSAAGEGGALAAGRPEVRGTWSATERRWHTRHREASPGRGSPVGRARRSGRAAGRLREGAPSSQSPPSIWSHRPRPLQAVSLSQVAQGLANVIGIVWDS